MNDLHDLSGSSPSSPPVTPASSGSSLEGVRRVGGGQLLPIESQSGRAKQGHPEVTGL